MSAPTLESVQAYYDERVEGKIRDFIDANPRIEAAVQLVAEWAPPNPKRILEIGCGIGASCWRMARAWPQAEVIGVDVSSGSIAVAQTCFQLPNLSYHAGLIKEGALDGLFDLILLMDTYEHIALGDRQALHGALKSLLGDEARLVITVPTPAMLKYLRVKEPLELQPVDEDVNPEDVIMLGDETGTQLLYYRQIGIWRYNDYAHMVFGRYQSLTAVALRECRPEGVAGLKRRAKLMLGGSQKLSRGRHDYVGSDVLRPVRRTIGNRFKVGQTERRQVVDPWFRRSLRKTGRIESR